MKMLTLVCREKLEGEVRALFNKLGVEGYTVISGLGGKGQTGSVSEHSWTDRNMMFMVALENHLMTSLVTALKQLYVRLLDEHLGKDVPLKVFLQSCEVIV